MSAYFLRTERLGFRTWTAADTDLTLGLWGDADVTRLIGGPFSSEQVHARLTKEITTHEQHGVQYWPVFLLATGEHVGCCGLRPYPSDSKMLEIGFHIRKASWGQGYAHEAACAVIDHAFNTLDVDALFAGHNPANAASRNLLTRLGFTYTHDEFYPPTGLNHPSYRLERP